MAVDRLERINSLLRRVIAESMFTVMQGGSYGFVPAHGIHQGYRIL